MLHKGRVCKFLFERPQCKIRTRAFIFIILSNKGQISKSIGWIHAIHYWNCRSCEISFVIIVQREKPCFGEWEVTWPR